MLKELGGRAGGRPLPDRSRPAVDPNGSTRDSGPRHPAEQDAPAARRGLRPARPFLSIENLGIFSSKSRVTISQGARASDEKTLTRRARTNFGL